MAEIPVERKSGSKAWLWLLVIVVLAVLAWLFFGRNDNREPATVGATSDAAPVLEAAPASIARGAWSVVSAA